MKRIVLVTSLALSVVLALSALTALAQEKQGEQAAKQEKSNQEVTLVGEVLDLYCYMKHPDTGQGDEHAKCAKTCINKGLPIGFLADGEVYVLIGKEHESAKDIVVDFAGSQARLVGTLIEHHGVKSIEVKSIEKVASSSGE